MSGPSCLAGLIGSGTGASHTSPAHRREDDEQGFRCTCQTTGLDVPKLGVEAPPDLLLAAQRMGFAGLNITHPCKQATLPLLDELPPDAQALEVVNTAVPRGGGARRSRPWRRSTCSPAQPRTPSACCAELGGSIKT